MQDSSEHEPQTEDSQTPRSGLTPGRALIHLSIAAVVIAGIAVFARPHSPFADELLTEIESVSFFGSEINCVSAEAQELALKIVRQNIRLEKLEAPQWQYLQKQLYGKSEIGHETAKSTCHPGFFSGVTENMGISLEYVTDQRGLPTCAILDTARIEAPAGPQTEGLTRTWRACLDIYHEQVSECQTREFRKAVAGVKYSLDAVRLAARDSATGKVTCAATLRTTLPSDWGSSHRDIQFTVEETTKNEIYVTVFGLE